MHDYLSVIRLGYGSGEPGKKACWMTALNSHIGGGWTDQCACVDPVINAACIAINDMFGADDESRTEAIMEFGLFAPLGAFGSREHSLARLAYLADQAKIRWMPHALAQARQWSRRMSELMVRVVRMRVEISVAAAIATHMATWAYRQTAFDAGRVAAAAFARDSVFQTLRELIDMGPHAPEEPGVPVCGVEKFHELVGVK